MKVYLDQKSLGIFILYHEVKNLPVVRIVVDVDIEDTINIIPLETEQVFKFCPCDTGLYCLNVHDMDNHYYQLTDIREHVTDYSLVQSVATNKKNLSKNKLTDADRALYYQELLGWSSMTTFQNYITKNMLINCKITIDDVN